MVRLLEVMRPKQLKPRTEFTGYSYGLITAKMDG